MKYPVILTLSICIASVFTACEKTEDLKKDYVPKFVIEGWIEQGGHPHVIISHNIPFFTKLDSAQLNEVVIRWAKVTVSDGEKEEILTGAKDSRYFPPYSYRALEMRGEAGKTYHLKVEYGGEVMTATTSIPRHQASIDSIWFISKEEGEKQQLSLKFTDRNEEGDYYRFYTRTPADKIFYPTLLNSQSDKFFNGKQIGFVVNRGPKNNLSVKNEPYFNFGDTVYVKLSAMPKEGFDYWSSFTDEVLNAGNPLIGSSGTIKSNIEGPAVGIWCGYHSSIYRTIAK